MTVIKQKHNLYPIKVKKHRIHDDLIVVSNEFYKMPYQKEYIPALIEELKKHLPK